MVIFEGYVYICNIGNELRAKVKCRRLGKQITCTHSIKPDTIVEIIFHFFFFCINNEEVITF